MSDPSSSPRPDLPVIEVWEEPNRLWGWRYLEPSENGQPLAFRSNKDYDSRQAALASATTAYPGVTVLEPATADPARSRPGARRRRLLLLLVLGLVVFLLWPRRRRPQPGRTSLES